jgi:DNA excision repair protein ERCC-4
LAIPIDETGHVIDTQIFYQQDLSKSKKATLVLVDVREFRAELPLLLHSLQCEIIPCTLNVGDYILSPTICVERKTIPDLISSLDSGRLYKQCQSMCLYYSTPILLIEFANENLFSLSFGSGDSDLLKRLVILLLSFPKIKVVWASSPSSAAQYILDLQINQTNPDLKIAQQHGTDLDYKTNIASEMLLCVPGIDLGNVYLVMRNVLNFKVLSESSLDFLTSLLGDNGKLVYNFFHDPIKIT